jgi:hypothetical protein
MLIYCDVKHGHFSNFGGTCIANVYRVIKGFFCKICRENLVILADCSEIFADIAGFPCIYCRKPL